MLKNYLKIALRTLRSNPVYATINILGLAVGLACSFFILLWVQGELSFDRFHAHGPDLYTGKRHAFFPDGQIFTWNGAPKPTAAALEEQFPEVVHAEMVSYQNEVVVTLGDVAYREEGYWADDAFFEIFSFPLLIGDPETVIDDPNSIVISEALAERLFGADWGRQNIIGRSIRIDNRTDFQISGVAAPVPDHSTLQFDFVIPSADFYQRNTWVEHWGNSGMQLFVQLQAGADRAAINEKVLNVIRDNHESALTDLFLQPYEDMHLHNRYESGQLVGGRIEYVRIFIIVAGFVLLMACINFMNLATARSTKRTREIGVRKSVGATQQTLIGQFLGESMLLALGAFVLALALVAAALPAFNAITEQTFSLNDLGGSMLLLFLGIAVLTGLVAGSYPALYLSSFSVIGIFRGGSTQGGGHAVLRKGLVVFQFALSVIFIIGTLTVARQVDYIRTKNLGLDKSNLIITNLEGPARNQYDALKNELLRRPGIESVTASSQNPLSVGSSTTDPTWEGKDPDSEMLFHIINSRYDFVETMDMDVVEGRTHSPAFGADSLSYVINETAALAMGMDQPIGQRLSFWGDEGVIIGVVRDFHMASLYSEIEPTIIRFDPEQTWMLFVRSVPGQTEEAVASVEEAMKQFNPDYPFEYRFLDQQYDQMYRTEMTVGTLASSFAVLAIFIACLGLFGLASFMTEQRTKEIGIRKVLGADLSGLVLLLTGDFVKLVLIAIVIGIPLAYFGMNQWLSNFAYRIDIGPGTFIAAGLSALVIAWMTVSYQSIRAALSNPVDALRPE